MSSSQSWNQEAEAAVLAAFIRNPDDFYSINDVGLTTDDFAGPENRRVAKALFEVQADKGKPDLPLIHEALLEGGHDATTEYLARLSTIPVSIPQAHDYARTVRGLSISRSLGRYGADVISIAQEHRSDYEGAVAEVESRLRKLTSQLPVEERSPSPADILRRIRNNEGNAAGIPILFSPTLQNLTGGFKPGHMWVIGGFSSTGKSAVAVNLTLDVLRARDKKVVIISAEMTQEQYLLRMLSIETGIPQQMLSSNVTLGTTQAQLEKAIKFLEHSNLLVYDTLYKMPKIRSELKRIKEHEGLDLVVLDYIQNISVTGDEVSDAREVALECQRLAKELSCCVVAFSQVSNAMAQSDIESGGKGEFYSFKGHGAIRDAADVALMLRRNRRVPDGTLTSNLKVQIAKNRHGALSEFVCEMNLPTGKITEVEEAYE